MPSQAHGGVHNRNRDEIGRDVFFDPLRDLDRLALVTEAGEDFDQAA
jgi:hypothetical protein